MGSVSQIWIHAVRAEDCAESQKKNGFGMGFFGIACAITGAKMRQPQ